MPLVAGTLTPNGDFAETNSLAKAMDDALPKKSAFGQTERRQLLIGIATGIIEYLKQHDTDSFAISVTVNASTHQGSGTLTIS